MVYFLFRFTGYKQYSDEKQDSVELVPCCEGGNGDSPFFPSWYIDMEDDENEIDLTGAVSMIILIATHFQVCGIYVSFDVAYPAWYKKWTMNIAIFSWFDFSMTSPECTTGPLAYAARWSLAVCIPVAIVLFFAVLSLFPIEARKQCLKTAMLGKLEA